ncbi:tryptophan decarboxylase 2-like [Panicum hallii]|uniref:tryptophan decarboxylase 2-like n=1 Tax=Panicum hallii TaxID=206008 RepID=UPI000DF4E8E5|nr:tryptophan decarboxylase 2-like [Panicum hallii]
MLRPLAAPPLPAVEPTLLELRVAASQANSIIDYKDWQISLGRRFRIKTSLRDLSGMFVLRFAVGVPLTEQQRVFAAWKLLQDLATKQLGRSQ